MLCHNKSESLIEKKYERENVITRNNTVNPNIWKNDVVSIYLFILEKGWGFELKTP